VASSGPENVFRSVGQAKTAHPPHFYLHPIRNNARAPLGRRASSMCNEDGWPPPRLAAGAAADGGEITPHHCDFISSPRFFGIRVRLH
jgi:hypothetical protein